MGGSILELEWRNEPIGDRIASAWRAIGVAGRLLTVLAASACVALALLGDSTAVVACGLSLLVLVLAALVDVVEHRLPNVVVLCAAVPVVTALALTGSGTLLRDVLTGCLVVAGPLLAVHLITPSGMGFGDVKAGAVLGAAMGLIDVELALLALVLGLGAGAAWGVATRARSIALGPSLVAGALAAVLIGAVS